MAQPAARQVGELVGELLRVVEFGDHHVLDTHPPSGALREATPGSEHNCNRPLAVDRHKLVAEGVVRGVQADRQVHLRQLLDHAVHARHDARRADRDVSCPDAEAVGVVQQPYPAEDGLHVVQRLPHPHEHDVVVAGSHARPPALSERQPRRPVPVEHLVHDLASGQLPAKAGLTRGAERAADRAPCLARDADRRARATVEARRRAHQH